MAELTGVDLGTHLRAIVAEYTAYKSIYGYPERKIYRGFPGFDFSVQFHDKTAATPLGPASGPHTQLAQNIVLAFLGGGRIIELKTVQILDQLEIPRPCIDVRNVGYNVEWSQELRLQDSYAEYVKAWVLLKLLEEMELLEVPKGDPLYRTVFDISVGYDLKGISSPQIHTWLQSMRDAGAAVGEHLQTLPPEFAEYRKLDIDPHIADSVTLSTFHGCPRDEIEAIVQHLIAEHHLHVIVKMNPTILGYDFVRRMLHEELGYTHIQLDPHAFESDLQFDEGVAMMQRLEKFAAKHGRKVGAKFTNTLVVHNTEKIFADEVQYLSGPPLHVLAMHAMHRFRREMGAHFHISFSAGITKHNFAGAVRCNMKPITTCTDLLKTGGYTRMFNYLHNLKNEMAAAGSRTIPEFILKSAGNAAGDDVRAAGMANAERLVPALGHNPRYHAKMNRKAPPKLDSHLTLFDCITCNKCLPVCPNAANFSIPSTPAVVEMTNYRREDGKFFPMAGENFIIEKEAQIANLADFCNECGDCDTYCPEHGGPFIEKPRFFFSQATYEKFDRYDGFFMPAPGTLVGRIDGREYRLQFDAENETYHWQCETAKLVFDAGHRLLRSTATGKTQKAVEIDTRPYYIMRVLLDGLMASEDHYAKVMLES